MTESILIQTQKEVTERTRRMRKPRRWRQWVLADLARPRWAHFSESLLAEFGLAADVLLFDQGKHREGNAEGGANIKKERTWRQYMNRRGGFNRYVSYGKFCPSTAHVVYKQTLGPGQGEEEKIGDVDLFLQCGLRIVYSSQTCNEYFRWRVLLPNMFEHDL